MSASAIIINADDLGLWPSIDDGIFAAWNNRSVSDSSVFANSAHLAIIIDRAKDIGMPVGIHLNLTCGRALSPLPDIPALVDKDGFFIDRKLWPVQLSADQIRSEFTRQIERVISLGLQPSHFDSHHHIHVYYPQIRQITQELALEYQLPLRAVDADMCSDLRANGLLCSDSFSMAFYGERATVETLINAVIECPGGVLEIMTHPGFFDDAMPGSYREERTHEYEVLTSASWRDYLAENGIPLINFTNLAVPPIVAC